MTRSGLRSVLTVLTVLTGLLTGGQASAAADSTTLLSVGFQGAFDGSAYRPASGEVVDGALTRNTGTESLSSGVVQLPGGKAGLTFTPSTEFTSGGAVTKSVAVEATVQSVQTGNRGLNTELSIAGGAYYRVQQGYQSSSSLSEFGMNGAPNGEVRGRARSVSTTRMDRIALVYRYAGPGNSSLTTYVDGCQVGKALVSGVPAQAAANAIGFGNDVHPNAADRGFLGKIAGAKVTAFTGDYTPERVTQNAMTQNEAQQGAGRPYDGPPVTAIGACDSPETIVDKATKIAPTPEQLAWQKQELTGFVHFGPNTFTGLNTGTGEEPPTTFAPTDVNTDQWAKNFKDAGFKKVILVVKHHDGFVLFPSRYTDYSVKSDTAWRDGKGDLVREFVQSMRKYGLKIGFYVSPADLHEALPGGTYANGSVPKPVTIPTIKPGDSRAGAAASGKLPKFDFELDDYNAYFLNQFYELLTEYGPVEEIWLDGANPTDRPEYYDWVSWFKMFHALQPHAVVFNGQEIRWSGNEAGNTRTSEWSPLPLAGDPATTHMVAEMAAEGADDLGGRDLLTNAANYLSWFPAECDTTMKDAWFWHPNGQTRTLEDLINVYHNTVGNNCQLLLNIGPDQTGQFDDIDVERLKQFSNRIHATFDQDGARGAAATASSSARRHGPDKVVDGDPDSYWEPEGTTGDLSLTLRRPQVVTEVVLAEAIAKGQGIESFAVDARVNGAWQQVTTGTTIGYKRILKLAKPVTADGIRLRLTGSRATPRVTDIGLSSYAPPTVTVTPAATTVQPGQSTDVDVTVTNVTGNAFQKAQAKIETGAGWQVTPATIDLGTLEAGATKTVRAKLTAPATGDISSVNATVSYDTNRIRDLTTSGAKIMVPFADLAASYDNVGVTDDSNPGPTPGFLGFDGVGTTFSAQGLAAKGITPGSAVTAEGVQLKWPTAAPGQPNNTMALGQTITVGKSGSKLTFLTAANNSTLTGAITVNYTDGTTAAPEVTVGNFWFPSGEGGNPANTQVVAVDFANYPHGSSGHTVHVFATSIPLDPAKTVRDITLPTLSDVRGSHAALHFFDMAVG